MILKQIDLELPQALHLFTSFIKLGWQFLQAGVYFTIDKYFVPVNVLFDYIDTTVLVESKDVSFGFISTSYKKRKNVFYCFSEHS